MHHRTCVLAMGNADGPARVRSLPELTMNISLNGTIPTMDELRAIRSKHKVWDLGRIENGKWMALRNPTPTSEYVVVRDTLAELDARLDDLGPCGETKDAQQSTAEAATAISPVNAQR